MIVRAMALWEGGSEGGREGREGGGGGREGGGGGREGREGGREREGNVHTTSTNTDSSFMHTLYIIMKPPRRKE